MSEDDGERLYDGEPLIRMDELNYRGGGILSRPRARGGTVSEERLTVYICTCDVWTRKDEGVRCGYCGQIIKAIEVVPAQPATERIEGGQVSEERQPAGYVCPHGQVTARLPGPRMHECCEWTPLFPAQPATERALPAFDSGEWTVSGTRLREMEKAERDLRAATERIEKLTESADWFALVVEQYLGGLVSQGTLGFELSKFRRAALDKAED